MQKPRKYLFFIVVFVLAINSSSVNADVYGGGFWEAIGLGNMPCQEFTSKSEESGYKELGAVWLSGFMSGVNFTSSDVYDITWGEDIYVLTDLVIKRCEEHPDKLLSDIATQIVYKRYQDKNFTATKDLEDK